MSEVKLPSIEDVMRNPETIVPKPKGYKLLVHIPAAQEKTDGGVFLTDEHRARQQTATMVARVVDMGSQAYQDPSRFPDGPWCGIGDWVMFRAHSGTRFKVGTEEFRLINDDTVEAVVADPTQIDRV